MELIEIVESTTEAAIDEIRDTVTAIDEMLKWSDTAMHFSIISLSKKGSHDHRVTLSGHTIPAEINALIAATLVQAKRILLRRLGRVQDGSIDTRELAAEKVLEQKVDKTEQSE